MSGENVAYHLRQNKFVERQLFVQVLSHINIAKRISSYVYVGFGGPYLEDFKVLHNAFGLRKMISLEEVEWIIKRQEFNKPVGSIKIVPKTSTKFLEDYQEVMADFGDASTITWFDFASPRHMSEQLADLQALLRVSVEYDVVKVTLNANLNTLYSPCGPVRSSDVSARRFRKLKGRVKNLLPPNADPGMMTRDQYPKLLLRILNLAVVEELRGKGVVLHPISTFTYADTDHTMLTFTGIVLKPDSVDDFLLKTGLSKFEFATNNWLDVLEIAIPNLSAREKLHLDQLLYSDRTTIRHPTRLRADARLRVALSENAKATRAEAEKYFRFQRFYPHFHPIDY